uniref:Uncharacterized protein n=1 Tax=Timema shepardi TaxID=629360 RepID=A0A7R9BAJ3_TIMSH|nr:unnamed protein product [Timema shepardi]
MEGQLSLEMETNQNRPCTAWNLSVLYHEFDTYLLSQGHRQELLFALVTRHGAAAVARHDKDATRIRPQVALTICVCQHSSVRPYDRLGAERCLSQRLRDLQVPLRPQFTRLGCQLLIKFRDGHASPFRQKYKSASLVPSWPSPQISKTSQ